MFVPNWNPRIEGLRGFSILLVFFFHLTSFESRKWGALGVGIFFMISGYVITGSMLRNFLSSSENSLSFSRFLKQFYARRARRLLPLAFAVILFTLIVSFLDPTADRKQYILSALFCLLYIGNFFGFSFGYTDLSPALGHFWTLAIEEQFYFIWPIIFFAVFINLKKKKRYLILLVILGIVLIGISHPLLAFANITVWTLPTTYFDLILMGCALQLGSAQIEKLSDSFLRVIQLFGYLSLLVILFVSEVPRTGIVSYFQYNLDFVLVCSVFIFALNSNFFNNRFLKFFGKISYSLYCIHFPLIVFGRNFIGDSAIIMFCLALFSVLLSVFSHKYFESRFYTSTTTHT